jgi:hypothetical protein
MWIDNLIRFFILLLVFGMGVKHFLLPFLYFVKQKNKEIVSSKDYFCDIPKDSIYKGFGLVKNKELILKENKPLIFSTIEKAENYKKQNKINRAEIVYQIWNPASKTVNIGRVKIGTN